MASTTPPGHGQSNQSSGLSRQPEAAAHPATNPVAQLLTGMGAGDDADQATSQRLMQMVYDELHRMADARLTGDPAHWIMRTTSMVHEAYLRLMGGANASDARSPDGRAGWKDRAYFFSAAATAMRRVLIDRIRRHHSLKEGGGQTIVSLDGHDIADKSLDPMELLALDEALTRLAQRDAEMARVVELKFFAGLPVQDIALALDIPEKAVSESWRAARAWLYDDMHGRAPPERSRLDHEPPGTDHASR